MQSVNDGRITRDASKRGDTSCAEAAGNQHRGSPVSRGHPVGAAPEVLDCFDNIVLNAGNTFRLQEECAFEDKRNLQQK